MWTVDDVQEQIDTRVTGVSRSTSKEFLDAIDASNVELSSRVLKKMKEILEAPPETYRPVLIPRVRALITRTFENLGDKVTPEQVPEASVFFWVHRHSGEVVRVADIAVQTQLQERTAAKALDTLLAGGYITRTPAPRNSGAYSYELADFDRIRELLRRELVSFREL